MKLFLCVCVLSSIILDISATAALQGCHKAKWRAPQDEHRTPRATGDSGQSNNMGVAFVPLISIIANLLPRFFNRYGSVPPATVQQQARSILAQNKGYFRCNERSDIGMKWTDHSSNIHYYQCHSSKYCSRTDTTPCFMVKRHQCLLPYAFDFKKQQCLQKTKF